MKTKTTRSVRRDAHRPCKPRRHGFCNRFKVFVPVYARAQKHRLRSLLLAKLELGAPRSSRFFHRSSFGHISILNAISSCFPLPKKNAPFFATGHFPKKNLKKSIDFAFF